MSTIREIARQAAFKAWDEKGGSVLDVADAVAVAVLREVEKRGLSHAQFVAQEMLAEFAAQPSAPVTPSHSKETLNGRSITDSRDTDLAVRPVVSATDPIPLAVQVVTPEPPRQTSCVNHNGFTGNTNECPTCNPGSPSDEVTMLIADLYEKDGSARIAGHLRACAEVYRIGSATDSAQRSEPLTGQERSAEKHPLNLTPEPPRPTDSIGALTALVSAAPVLTHSEPPPEVEECRRDALARMVCPERRLRVASRHADEQTIDALIAAVRAERDKETT